MMTVSNMDAVASKNENLSASIAPGCWCTFVNAPSGVMPVTDHKRNRDRVRGASPSVMTITTAAQ